MSINALNTNAYYNQFQMPNGYEIKHYDPNEWQLQPMPQNTPQSAKSDDGQDDGKISFGKKVKNFFKGCWNGLKGMVTGAIKHPIKTALMIGACCIPGVGPFIAGGLAAYGIVKGGASIVKNAVAAHNATTDAEAEAAWQGIGTGSFQVGASVVAMKCAVKTIKANNAAAAEAGTNAIKSESLLGKDGKIMGSIKNGTNTFRGSNMGQSLENSSLGKMAKAAKEGVTKNKGLGKVTETFKNVKEVVKNETNFGEAFKNSNAKSKLGKISDGLKGTKQGYKTYIKENTSFGELYQQNLKGTGENGQVTKLDQIKAAKDAANQLRQINKAHKQAEREAAKEDFQKNYEKAQKAKEVMERVKEKNPEISEKGLARYNKMMEKYETNMQEALHQYSDTTLLGKFNNQASAVGYKSPITPILTTTTANIGADNEAAQTAEAQDQAQVTTQMYDPNLYVTGYYD